MPGRAIKIVPLQKFTFTDVTTNKQFVLMARKIDVSKYATGDLVVRLHSTSIPSNGSMTVVVFPDAYTEEDPTTNFVGDESVADVTFTENDSAGKVRMAYLDDGPWGQYFGVSVEAVMSTGTDDIEATISADIVVRE